MSQDKWFFASKSIEEELPIPPQRLLDGATLIKHNPVREVFCRDGYFIKRDSRHNHNFSGEFASAHKLERKKIPVVEHLAHGKCEDGNFLITRELSNAQTVEEYLFDNPVTEKFLEDFSKFLQEWKNGGFFHTDAHWGNVMYVPGEGGFVLVDVRGVRKKFFWEWGFRRCSGDIIRFIFNMRGNMSFAQITEFMKKFNCRAPECHLHTLLKNETRRLQQEWDKRRRQLFSAYPKFSIQRGKMLVAAPYIGNYESLPEESSPDAKAEFAASFFLSLLQIPHRRVCAVNPDENLLRRAPELTGTPSGEEIADAAIPLEMCGLCHHNSEWRYYRNMAALNDLSTVIRARMFQ